MAATQEKTPGTQDAAAATVARPTGGPVKIDLTAPAGSKHSLGEESVRDGRPATDDSIVEAIDEADPGVPDAPAR